MKEEEFDKPEVKQAIEDLAEGKNLGVMSIRKLFKDITERSKSVGVPDYRTR